MQCIIVDDEATARVILSQIVASNSSLKLVGEFSNAIEAIKFLNKEAVDMVLLDIHMPGFSGFDFIETLQNPPKIILTTSDKDFALDAFEYSCIVDYLVKPITQERFDKAIQKAKNFTASSQTVSEKPDDNDLYVNINRRLVKIKLQDIYLIEAKGDYIHIKTESGNHIVHATLKKIEEKLPTTLFLKVHRSYIINTTKIIDIEDNSVLIKQDIIPVSRANRSELMQRLNLL